VGCTHILSGEFEPSRNELECPADWRVKKTPILTTLRRKAINWLREQTTLLEALSVAISFHVLLFPIIWFMGWALPWPKPPSVTVVIELNLENWPNVATPEKIEELYGEEMIKARHRK
jgi:hypothetical protein